MRRVYGSTVLTYGFAGDSDCSAVEVDMKCDISNWPLADENFRINIDLSENILLLYWSL